MRFHPRHLGPLIRVIAEAANRMCDTESAAWQSRIESLYGEMNGQRAVDFSSFAPAHKRRSVIASLETIYYLSAVLTSTAAMRDDPAGYLGSASRLTPARWKRFLRDAIDGTVYRDIGVQGWRNPCSFDWLAEDDRDLNTLLRQFVCELASLWDGTTLEFPGDDLFQTIHRQLFPADLNHVTGQVYTPEWLAQWLIDDAEWTADERLVDPFCGSGVFLVKALRQALGLGFRAEEVLENLIGIDIDPFSAAVTQANLVLCVARHAWPLSSACHLQVVCADSIAPSVQKGLMLERNTEHPCPPADALTIDGGSLDRLAPLKGCADVVATNPPWVGWEYLPRQYREFIQPAWLAHDLYRSKGLEASFLKEDLSNLALMSAWDFFLADQGRSVVVLRPSTMHSEVASRGVRRLSLSTRGTDLELQQIRTFEGIRVFESASTGAATWRIKKGSTTVFPVTVLAAEKCRPRWNPSCCDSLQQILSQLSVTTKVAEPTDPGDCGSRWMITEPDRLATMRRLRGTNAYTPRMGVFTGGANGVFYLEKVSNDSATSYRNLTARAKRKVPSVTVDVEKQLVHRVARGRDLQMWHCRPEVFLLFPHSQQTQMYPLGEEDLATNFPKACRYLQSMETTLRARKGFAGWEKKIHQSCFYTLQRIGPYTFAPYKVCWRYVARKFTVCVLGTDDDGKVIVPNDKVMFIPSDNRDEAHFLAGWLSSSLIRQYVESVSEKRQVSTTVIRSLSIPSYDSQRSDHRRIRDCCRRGHQRRRFDPHVCVQDLQAEIDRDVNDAYCKNVQ